MRGEGVRGEGAELEREQPRREHGVEEAAAHDRASHAVIGQRDRPLRVAPAHARRDAAVREEDAQQKEEEGEAQADGRRAWPGLGVRLGL